MSWRRLRQEVSAAVREACATLMRNSDEMRLHDQQADVLNEAVSAALAEYTTGKVPQAEVLRAQMALTRLNEHLIELEEERDARAGATELADGSQPRRGGGDCRQLPEPGHPAFN